MDQYDPQEHSGGLVGQIYIEGKTYICLTGSLFLAGQESEWDQGTTPSNKSLLQGCSAAVPNALREGIISFSPYFCKVLIFKGKKTTQSSLGVCYVGFHPTKKNNKYFRICFLEMLSIICKKKNYLSKKS